MKKHRIELVIESSDNHFDITDFVMDVIHEHPEFREDEEEEED